MVKTAHYEDLIQTELDKIDYLPTRKALRDGTIRAVAQAIVDGESIRSILYDTDRPANVVSGRVYYNSKKPYNSHPEFKATVRRVAEIYRKRELAIKEAADEAARRKRHKENAAIVNRAKFILAAGIQEFELMINDIREKREEAVKAGLDLLDVPGIKMKPTDLAAFMKMVLGEERLVHDEVPAAKIKADTEWDSNLPPGVTEDDADEAYNAWAERVVAQELDKELNDDDW
jgi:hypothetical protein